MTELKFTTMKIMSAKMNGESSLPGIERYVGQPKENAISQLGEDEGLYISYGFIPCIFPYRMQDRYTRKLFKTDLRIAVLENEYLKAVFYPDYGGKLASLYDKVQKRDLLDCNPVIRPCNLALRNAWTSGGIEFNCGPWGHNPFTCSTLHTAKASLSDGTPVLRFYEFERLRQLVYQIDFFLPEGSKMLFARMRLTNPNCVVKPAYWWSNMAVPEAEGSRTIVPADGAYSSDNYSTHKGQVFLAPVPVYNGHDITYGTENPVACDYFFKIPDRRRKYEIEVDKGGYGMIQTSTSMLKGRKQFVWGQGPGGDRWQKFLTEDGGKMRYIEIQAGLAHSQYEHIPMPARTTWEWLEAYGALQCDPKKTMGDWHGAQQEVEDRLNEIITDEKMEEILAATKADALKPAKEVVIRGSGWGALEKKRRAAAGEEDMCPHLDFGETGDDQDIWDALLEKDYDKIASISIEDVPKSWMLDEKWLKMLENALRKKGLEDTAKANLQLRLGIANIVTGKYKKARSLLDSSLALAPSAWSLYGLAKLEMLSGHTAKAADYMARAVKLKPDDINIARESFRAMAADGKFAEILADTKNMPEEVLADGRVQVFVMRAKIETGDLESAEEELLGNGGFIIPDIQEGENSLTDLWFLLEEKKAARDGKKFDSETAVPPESIDFRMFATKD